MDFDGTLLCFNKVLRNIFGMQKYKDLILEGNKNGSEKI